MILRVENEMKRFPSAGCARMLHDEGETVGRVALRRLEKVLDGRPLADEVAARIVSDL